MVILNVNALVSTDIHGLWIYFLTLPKMKACVGSLVMTISLGVKISYEDQFWSLSS